MSQTEQSPETPSSFAAPQVNVPKGGGAIRGLGEKFQTNPAHSNPLRSNSAEQESQRISTCTRFVLQFRVGQWAFRTGLDARPSFYL
jgi:hypothetical protein